MDKPTVPSAPAAPAAVDPIKAELEKRAQLEATAKRLKAEAHVKAREAAKALAEAEEVLYADWRPGLPGKREVFVPRSSNIGDSQPKINGREIVGRVELDYDTFRSVMHMVTQREAQEKAAREGYFKGIRISDPISGQVRFVDSWDPKAEGLVGVDGR